MVFFNQPTIVIVENILEEKETEVFAILEIPEEQVKLEKGYYSCVYFMLRLKKQFGVDSNYYQADMQDNPDEEDMDDDNIDNDRERHWRMVFEDNDGGMGDKESFFHAKSSNVYVNEK